MALPSTMLVSFIFIAHINGVESLIQSIPRIPYALIGSILYVLVYFLSARTLEPFQIPLSLKIFLSWIIANLCWIIFPILSTQFPQDNIWFSFSIYLIAVVIIQPIFIWISNKYPNQNKPHKMTKSELLFRVCFSGTIVALALILSKTAGSYWGVIIGASYPASFGSQLIIFQRRYPASFLVNAIRVIPIGLIPLIIFTISVSYTYQPLGIFIGTLLSIIFCLITAWLISQSSKRFINK